GALSARHGSIEIAGPERAPFNQFVARYLKVIGDAREVVRDPEARYFGGRVNDRTLVPLAKPRSAVSVWTNGSTTQNDIRSASAPQVLYRPNVCSSCLQARIQGVFGLASSRLFCRVSEYSLAASFRTCQTTLLGRGSRRQ